MEQTNQAPLRLISVFSDLSRGFLGNVAAVIRTETPFSSTRMQQIAADLNQPATTFLWPGPDKMSWNIRWFAPDGEIDLCGHGTMAATAYLSEGKSGSWNFIYRSGIAGGESDGQGRCTISLVPIVTREQIEIPPLLQEALGIPVLGLFRTGNKHLLLTDSEASVKNMQPDFCMLRAIDIFGYAVTAPGEKADFVSRTLVPHVKQLEDHATGSSHAVLAPYWAEALGKTSLKAIQNSPRGGYFECELKNQKVFLSGGSHLIAAGTLA